MSVFSNPLFQTILLAGVGAQLLKIVLFYTRTKRIHLLDIVATGGMPSSHSALLAGLTTAIYLNEKLTTAFFVALALTSVVIIDAFGVRRTAGEEGQILHRLIEKAKLKVTEPHYSLGHTPLEVFVGVLFGIVAAFIVMGI